MKMTKLIFLTGFLLTAAAAAVSAQSTIEQSIKNSRDQFSDIKNRSNELERMKQQADKDSVERDAPPKFPEIKDDFEQIQKINSDSLQTAFAKTTVDYGDVLKFVSEINRRAVRLNSKLFLAEYKESKKAGGKQQSSASPDITILIGELDKSIDKFVHNSIFQNTNLVNSQDSLKAQKELETVIETSSAIKEKAKSFTRK